MTDHTNNDHDPSVEECVQAGWDDVDTGETEDVRPHFARHALEYCGYAYQTLQAALEAGETPGNDIIAAKRIDEANAWSHLSLATATAVMAIDAVEDIPPWPTFPDKDDEGFVEMEDGVIIEFRDGARYTAAQLEQLVDWAKAGGWKPDPS